MWTLLNEFWSKYQFQSRFKTPKQERWSLKGLRLTLPTTKAGKLSLHIEMRTLAVFAMMFGIYIFAGETNSPWLYLLESAFLGAVILGFILPLLQVIDVLAGYSMPLTAMARDSVELKVTLSRRWLFGPTSRFIPLKWLLVRARISHNSGVSDVLKPLAIEYIGSEAWVFASTGTLSRGIYKLEGLEFYSCFPFGLFWWSRSVDIDESMGQLKPCMTVFPQMVPIEGNFLYRIRSATDSPMGLISSRTTKAVISSSVRGVREFVHGDSPRLIHWSSSARVGKLLAREFEVEGLPGFDLLINLRASWVSKEQFELAISVTYSLLHLGFKLGGNPDFMVIPNLDNEDKNTPIFMSDMPKMAPGLGRWSQVLARVEPLRQGRTNPGQITNLGTSMHQALLTVRPVNTGGDENNQKFSDAVELAVIPRTWEAASGAAVQEVHLPVHDQGIINRRSARGRSAGRVLATIDHLEQVTSL